MHALKHRVLQMALVLQDNVQLMLRHLNVGVCVCWVPKLSLQSWRYNQWSQREWLSDQSLHISFKMSCFVRALLTGSHLVYKGSTDTFTLASLSESYLAWSASISICETFMVTLSINKQTGEVLSLCQENQQSSGKHELLATTACSCSSAAG